MVRESHRSKAAAVNDPAAEMLILHSLQTSWQKLPVDKFLGMILLGGAVGDSELVIHWSHSTNINASNTGILVSRVHVDVDWLQRLSRSFALPFLLDMACCSVTP